MSRSTYAAWARAEPGTTSAAASVTEPNALARPNMSLSLGSREKGLDPPLSTASAPPRMATVDMEREGSPLCVVSDGAAAQSSRSSSAIDPVSDLPSMPVNASMVPRTPSTSWVPTTMAMSPTLLPATPFSWTSPSSSSSSTPSSSPSPSSSLPLPKSLLVATLRLAVSAPADERPSPRAATSSSPDRRHAQARMHFGPWRGCFRDALLRLRITQRDRARSRRRCTVDESSSASFAHARCHVAQWLGSWKATGSHVRTRHLRGMW